VQPSSMVLIPNHKVVVIMISWMTAVSFVKFGGQRASSASIFVNSLTSRFLAPQRTAVAGFSCERINITPPTGSVRWMSSRSDDDVIVDGSGRRVRNRSTSTNRNDEWGNSNDGGGDSFDDNPTRGSRRRNTDYDRNDKDDDWGQPANPRSGTVDRRSNSGGGWDDFNPLSDDNRNGMGYNRSARRSTQRQTEQPQRRVGGREDFQDRQSSPSRNGGRGDRSSSWSSSQSRSLDRSSSQPRSSDRRGGDNSFRPRRFGDKDPSERFDRRKPTTFNKNSDRDGKEKSERSIDMNALEGAGFVHLYGISSVLNALTANRRDFVTSLERSDGGQDNDGTWSAKDDDDDNDKDDDDFYDTRASQKGDSKAPVKPQTKFRPYLFLQERSLDGGRRGSKASATEEILQLAKERQVSIEYVDKGILNTLSGNRPHQGMVLRCGRLFFEGLARIPLPGEGSYTSSTISKATPSIWLVLDEVVDPQNLGALLRSAYFLGREKVGILVCAKNSAPPSPVVSAASAGALEIVDIHSTVNLPRTLNQAKDDGFRIIGASSSVPHAGIRRTEDVDVDDETGPHLYDLHELPKRGDGNDNRPILLVLGSEGHGLRALVAKACTEFVRIPSGMVQGSSADHNDTGDTDSDSSITQSGVDSLNVSVTGGIMLWHLLNGRI
jgi:21S rRNA (GM2251-2'-O)-methyltransferase